MWHRKGQNSRTRFKSTRDVRRFVLRLSTRSTPDYSFPTRSFTHAHLYVAVQYGVVPLPYSRPIRPSLHRLQRLRSPCRLTASRAQPSYQPSSAGPRPHTRQLSFTPTSVFMAQTPLSTRSALLLLWLLPLLLPYRPCARGTAAPLRAACRHRSPDIPVQVLPRRWLVPALVGSPFPSRRRPARPQPGSVPAVVQQQEGAVAAQLAAHVAEHLSDEVGGVGKGVG